MFETGKNYPWRTVRMHYKQRIVSHLKEYTDDQRMIDRLQYPFLDRVYKLRVQYQVSALVLQDPAIIARNKLIIKYEIDPRFDADVVKVFKRYHTSSMQICINVQDPAYELSERWQKFLLKPTKSRHRLKLTMCGDLWFSKFPAYMNRTVRKAPVAVTQQSSQESCSSSVILLDNVPVRIEECTSPAPPAPFSPRQLLSFESLDCDTLVLQMLDIHGNMNDSPKAVQGSGNVDKPGPIDANVPPRSTHASDGNIPTSEEPQETFYPMPDCVFDSTDSEDEDEDMRNESRQPVANGNVDKSVAIDSNPPPQTHPSYGDVSSSEDLQESFCPMPDVSHTNLTLFPFT
ncbi:AGAP007495-PA [Anopheles gambiae str. PEST]|uniref:AGAP007495-PA n=1 Tax=Anopheles gambiae TaxID=7165 RepID=Q5TWZ2_ANOGA|nr:AGAP007495-PA [Anopheles gambiae str. PEST]